MIEQYGYDGNGITIGNSTDWAEQKAQKLILQGCTRNKILEQMRNYEPLDYNCSLEPKTAIIPKPTRIIYHDPATIVFWDDGTKTVVKCMEGTAFSAYYGFLCALGKKIYGSNRAIERIVWEGEVQL